MALKERRTGRPISAEEAHWSTLMAGHRCAGCGSEKPTTRIQVFYPVKDLPSDLRQQMALDIKLGIVKPVRFDDGQQGLRVSEVFACAACAPQAERSAAHGPSYARVIIDRPPRAIRALVSVA